MRGVVLGICPDASLVDITHEVAPQDILGGALELAASYKYFPERTIFLCVIDPGVGSSRRGLAAEAGGYQFVAPDNGLLTMVFREAAPTTVVELTDKRYARPTVSRTFEGRDRFAPAAGWLASGIAITSLGPPMTNWKVLDVPEPRVVGGELAGVVLRIDRFGNLVTNIDRRTFNRFAEGRPVVVVVAEHAIQRVVGTYAEADDGAFCALFGSSDHLEVAIPSGSAAERLDTSLGARIVVRLKPDAT